MAISRLQPKEDIPYGEEIKYSKLCDVFGLEKQWGGYMDRNISKISYEYELEINNKYYKILNKLPIPKYEQIDERFCISYDNKNMAGVYIIQKENDVYIGQTNNFYRRFLVHRGGYNKTSENTKILLENCATFKALEFEEDIEKRFIAEAFHTKKYINDGFNVISSEKYLYKGTNKNIKQNRLSEPKMGITFNKSDLEKITKLLSDNNIDFKPHKFRDKKETN